MFDPIVEVKINEIESVLAITFLEHSRGIVRYEKAETRGEIVCCPDQRTQFIELDVFTIAWKDTWG